MIGKLIYDDHFLGLKSKIFALYDKKIARKALKQNS